MKKLLVLLFSILVLPVSVNASDVYYCSDDSVTGFDPSENYKPSKYLPEKFKIMIDFENANVVSEKLYFHSDQQHRKKCLTDYANNLYCINDVGTAFSINKKNLMFHRSEIFISTPRSDDIYIAYGSCEKF